MLARNYEKLLLGFAIFLLAASGLWVFMQSGSVAHLEAAVISPVPSDGAYQPVPVEAATVTTEVWPQPVSQSAGAEWLYDVFTPPTIYFNPVTKVFQVTPQVKPTVTVDPRSERQAELDRFGVTLVETKVPEYRLQLVGYIGEGEGARGQFENTLTGDIILGRPGRRIADLQIEVRSIEVNRAEFAATAVVLDERTGEEITLDTRTRRVLEGQRAAVLESKATGTRRTLAPGEAWPTDGYTFTLDSVELSPPKATVTKSGGDLVEPKSLTLEIPAPARSEPAAPADAGTTPPPVVDAPVFGP